MSPKLKATMAISWILYCIESWWWYAHAGIFTILKSPRPSWFQKNLSRLDAAISLRGRSSNKVSCWERESQKESKGLSPPPPEEEACKNFNASISPFFSLSMTNVQMKHPPLIPNVFFSLYPMEASPFHPFLLLFPPYQMDTNCPHSDGATVTSCRKKCAKWSNTFSIIVQILLLSNLVNLSPLQKKTLANSPPFYAYNSSCPSSPSLSLSPFFARQCGWKRRRSP